MAKKKEAKTKRKSPIGRYRSFIYPDSKATEACARFAYRYPIELVRDYEALEKTDPNNVEALQGVIPTGPERDSLTDEIIFAISELTILKVGGGSHPATMPEVVSWIAQGTLVHKLKDFQNSDDPAAALRARIYRIAKKLGKTVLSEGKHRPSIETIIERALYAWWSDNIEGTARTVGIDKHGNPTSGSQPIQPTRGPTKADLHPYLLQHGLDPVPSANDKDFWYQVKEQAEAVNAFWMTNWRVPTETMINWRKSSTV
jgi:hypothetical protein